MDPRTPGVATSVVDMRIITVGRTVVVPLSLNGAHQGDLPMGLGTLPATGKEFHVPCIDVFHVEDGKVSAFDCHYAGTILLGQLGVLGNLEAALKGKTAAPRPA